MVMRTWSLEIRTTGKREKGSITPLNHLGNKIFNGLINFAMKSHVTDSLSGYRALFRTTFKEWYCLVIASI